MKIKSLDIIIVNWNSGKLLEDCILSMEMLRNKSFHLEKIIVVDNFSTDNSILFLDRYHTNKLPYELILVRNKNNCGFARACNQGATKSNADFLLFLNPDTRLFPDSLENVMSFSINKNPLPGIVGVQLVDENNQPMKTCRYFPTKSRRLAEITGFSKIAKRTGIKMVFWNHNDTREVNQIMGAFFLVISDCFGELKGFDERFFMYYEEVDFCKRSQEAGYKCLFYSDSKVFHLGGGSSRNVKDKSLFYFLRSWILYQEKHHGKVGKILSILIVIFEYLPRRLNLRIKNRSSEIADLNSAYAYLIRELKKNLT